MALEIQVCQLANAIFERDAGTLLSKMMMNWKEKIHAVVLGIKEEDSNNEKSITIEFDPSMEEL